MLNAKPRPRNNQEAFVNAWTHFVVECHPRAVTSRTAAKELGTGVCVYRSDDGLNGCAIGCQLPDEQYDPTMEAQGISNFVDLLKIETNETFGIPVKIAMQMIDWFKDCDIAFLVDLQNAHDHASMNNLENRLRSVALKWDLTIP